jgi:hypothetical protein
MRGVNQVEDKLIVWGDRKKVFIVDKDSGKVERMFKNIRVLGTLVTSDQEIYLYNKKKIFKLNLEQSRIIELPISFENLLNLEESDDKIYFFDGYEYGYLNMDFDIPGILKTVKVEYYE